MTKVGTRIVETGTLVRTGHGGKVELMRDVGGRWSLDLDWLPAGMKEMRVKVIGTVVDDELVDVDGIVAIHV